MKTVMDSVNEITPDLHGGTQHSRAVKARVAVTADACRRRTMLVLPETGRTSQPSPVGTFGLNRTVIAYI